MDIRKYIKSGYKIIVPALVSILLYSGCENTGGQDQDNNSVAKPVDLVEPLVDAANSRWFFFSSATRPFGLVNLSPDMKLDGAWNSGYRYNEDTIRCFSHIHAWQLSGIPVLPTTGNFKGHLGPDQYGSLYSHDQETARPGYHQVNLQTYGIQAELTATKRVGFHRYTFPESAQSQILFDFSTVLGPSPTDSGYVKLVNDHEIEGYAVMAPTSRRPQPAWVHFVARLDQPFDQLQGWKDGELVGEIETLKGPAIGCYLNFSTAANEVRMMKVGISYVSIEQARLNLETELPHWDFEQVVEDAQSEWNQMLGRIKVEGGTETEQRRFYTDLWHALQGRRVLSDVSGKYCDMTGDQRRVGQIPLDENGQPEFNYYNSDSFWGAQWTLNTLWQLVYPEIAEEFVNSMLQMYDDGGLIPRGPSGGNYTNVMTGASSTPFVVAAWMKGLKGFDIEKAYEGLKKNHLPGGMMSKAGYEHYTTIGGGIEYYIERGYVPHPLAERRYGGHQDGSGQTLEYAYQDWTLAQLAKELGKEEDYQYFMDRAGNYRNIWYDSLGWMWIRNLDGNWLQPIDILKYGSGWVEGNAAQFTWFVPHDLKGLAELMGGQDLMTKKLDSSFQQSRSHAFTSSKTHDQETTRQNRRVYINYGNQPSMQTAFIFNYSGAPWLTQYWSRMVIDSVYSGISPQLGYSGDEDQGLMGSMAVLMKMGLFSMKGGADREPFYEIGSPIFDRITIELNPDYYEGENFIIEIKNNGPKNYYVQSASLNDEPLNKPWFLHDTLIKGGKLTLRMSAEPNKEWGSGETDAPPAMKDELQPM